MYPKNNLAKQHNELQKWKDIEDTEAQKEAYTFLKRKKLTILTKDWLYFAAIVTLPLLHSF